MYDTIKRRSFCFLVSLLLSAVSGCGGGAQELKDFKGRVTESTSTDASHSLSITYTGQAELRDCAVTITIFHEDGERTDLKRNWAVWRPGEEKKVEFKRGRFQWCEMSGTAYRGAERINFKWRYSKVS